MSPDNPQFRIGAHFLAWIFNGDDTGLDDSESIAVRAFEADARSEYGPGHFATVDDSADEFARCEITGLMGACETVEYVRMPRAVGALS